MDKLKQLVKSILTRKFLLAVVSASVVFSNHMWNLGLTEDQIWAVLTPVLAFIGLEGIADIKSRQPPREMMIGEQMSIKMFRQKQKLVVELTGEHRDNFYQNKIAGVCYKNRLTLSRVSTSDESIKMYFSGKGRIMEVSIRRIGNAIPSARYTIL